LSDKVLYFVLSLICKDTNLPIIPNVTIAFAAVSKNILLPISFDLITVFPELGLSISITYKSQLINIKQQPKYREHKESKKHVVSYFGVGERKIRKIV
jgi:hypothetical protein